MSIEALIRNLRLDPAFMRNVTAWEILPAQPAHLFPLPAELDPALAAALRSAASMTLYSHQAACWQSARRGENVVVVTPTASGKTLCYNLPVVHDLLRRPNRPRPLPLSQPKPSPKTNSPSSTTSKPHSLAPHSPLCHSPLVPPSAPATYDGDTPQRNRASSANRRAWC